MVEPPKQFRFKARIRKRTMDPTVIEIKESDHKTEAAKSASPTPRRKVAAIKRKATNDVIGNSEEVEVGDVEMQSPPKKVTSVKTNMKDIDKKTEVEQVSTRKRKQPCKKDVAVETPTKRVTRSARGQQKGRSQKDGAKKVNKLNRNKEDEDEDWEEKEDTEDEEQQSDNNGHTEKQTRYRIPKNVNEKKERRKGNIVQQKKGMIKEGTKKRVKKATAKSGERKKSKVEEEEKTKPPHMELRQGFQFRSNLVTVVGLLHDIPNGEFSPLQVKEIRKTPFAELVLGIVEARLDEAYVRKSDNDILKLVLQYERAGGRFKLGSESVVITAREFTLIFGIQSGPNKIVLNPCPRVPETQFANRICPGRPGQRLLYMKVLREFFKKAVTLTTVEAAKDVARVLTLLLLGTLFYPNTQNRLSWGWLEFVEQLEDATTVKKYVENYMKHKHAEMQAQRAFELLPSQSTRPEVLFQDENFNAPISSPRNAPQQENTTVDCGVIVCMIMDLLQFCEPIPKTLLRSEIDQFRAGLVSRFLNDKDRSWTIAKWQTRQKLHEPLR